MSKLILQWPVIPGRLTTLEQKIRQIGITELVFKYHKELLDAVRIIRRL